MEKTINYPVKVVYERTGIAMELLLNAAPKMLADKKFQDNGNELYGPKKNYKKQAA